MRRALLAVLAASASISFASPASAITVSGDPFFVQQFSGSTDCPLPASGGFNNCWATTSGVVGTQPTDPNASRVVAAYDGASGAATINSSSYPTFAGTEVVWGITNQVLSITYTMGAGDPLLKYLTIKQADGYALFYDSAGFTSGTTYTFNLNNYFPNNPGISHFTLYDTTGGVPEPATWAMMLLGFGGIGLAMRRRRKIGLAQLA